MHREEQCSVSYTALPETLPNRLGITTRNTVARGKSKIFSGHKFGGKSVLDD